MSAILFRVRFVVISLIIACLMAVVFFRSSLRSEANSATAAFVPIIGATKSVAVVVGNADADADPGETLEYTVTISNTGPDPATGVAINDTIQNITTLVAGSTIASPVAANDTFSSIGNVGISVPDGVSDLLANDLDANNPGSSAALTITVAPTTSSQGGNVSINTTTGAFTYNPPPGFEGTDTFTYTLSNGTGLTDTATVTINVSGMIWFINNNAPACTTLGGGCGRLSNPFSTLAAFQALNNNTGNNPAANDNIFVFESATGYSGGITLLNGQKLIGQDATATLATITGITVPPFSNALPAMNSANGTFTNLTGTTTLSTNAVVRGLRVNSTTATGLNDPASAITGVNVSEIATVTTTTGTAVLLSDTGGTISLTSISSNGAANGISLTNTSGSFTVVGDGTNTAVGGNGSGGTIANAAGADGATTGNGVYLSNAQNVTLRRMTINGTNQNHAIRGITVSNFNLEYSTVAGTNGNNAAQDEGSVRFSELTGAASFLNCNISGGFEDNIRIGNTSGTLNRVTVTGTTIGANSTTDGNDGITIETLSSANINATLQNNTFTSARGDLFQFNSNASSGATDDLIFNNNTLSNNHPAIATGGGGTSIFSNGGKDFTFHIEGNSFRDAVGGNVLLVKSTGASTFSGTFTNNIIGVAVTANSGSAEGSGFKIQNAGQGTVTAAITNNQIFQYNNNGIEVLAGGGASPFGGNLNMTITGNTVSNPGNTAGTISIPKNAIHFNIGTVVGDTYFTCANITGNNIFAGGLDGVPATVGDNDIRLRARQSTTIRMPGYGGGNTDNTAAQNFAIANNSVGGVPTAIAFSSNATGGFVGGAACTLPSTIAPPADGIGVVFGAMPYETYGFTSESPAFTGDGRTFTTAILTHVAEFATKLGEMISPTAYTEEIANSTTQPFSGELVTKSLGTLPAGKSIVVKFRATVDNGPYAAGVNNITNTATISGSNFSSVNSTTSSIPLDAAPNLSVNATDGSSETQPGVVGLYNLTYANATGINLQGTNQTRLSVQVPVNTSFNLASSGTGWSCADGATNPTVCTNDVGALAAGGGGSKLIAFNINGNLPATALTIAPTVTIAENPANDNGTDLDPANNTSTDTDNVRGIWIGGTSTDWATNTNWSNNLLPNPSQNISVPSGGGTNSPSITSLDVTVGRLLDSGKNVTIGAGRTLLANLSVDLGANNILGAGTLELASGAPITRTTGQVNCALKKNFINGNIAPESPQAVFIYPVGTATGYSPVTANVSASSNGSLTVKAVDGTAPSTPALNDLTTLNRYWQLTKTGTLTADMTFTYLQADVDGTEANYRLIRTTASSPPVRFQNGVPCPGVGSPCVDPTSPTGGTIFVAGVQSFDNNWTAGEPVAPTPASVSISGRVLTSEGQGIRNARIVVTGNTLVEPRFAQTGSFGSYTVDGLQAGETYVITVNSRRFTFQMPSLVITALDNMTDVDFTADHQ